MILKSFSACTLLSILFLVVIYPTAIAQPTLFNPDAKQKAEALLKQMTVDEKVGQLNESARIVMPGIADRKPDELIIQGKVGSVLWLNDVKEINRLQHLAVEKSRLHIPIIFGFDARFS